PTPFAGGPAFNAAPTAGAANRADDGFSQPPPPNLSTRPSGGGVAGGPGEGGYAVASTGTRPPSTNPPPTAQRNGPPPKLVNSTRFTLNYQVDDVGKSGLESVALYQFERSQWKWTHCGDDTDLRSPFEVTVPAAGLYSFSIAAKTKAGVGGEEPQPSDAPQIEVLVDLSKPDIKLYAPTVDQGIQAGTVFFTWWVHDDNLGPRPVTLEYAENANGPWRTIAANLENTGKFQWKTPADVPYQFYVQLVAPDLAGNVGRAQTEKPVIVDLSRPKVKLLGVGVDASAPPPPK
ncbi:MAG: hypothetical protein ACRDD1_14165, partial [Planctomycetia bacterium]